MIQHLTFLVSESLYLNELVLSANNDEEDNNAKHTSTYLEPDTMINTLHTLSTHLILTTFL